MTIVRGRSLEAMIPGIQGDKQTVHAFDCQRPHDPTIALLTGMRENILIFLQCLPTGTANTPRDDADLSCHSILNHEHGSTRVALRGSNKKCLWMFTFFFSVNSCVSVNLKGDAVFRQRLVARKHKNNQDFVSFMQKSI